MSRITVPTVESAMGATAEAYAQVRKGTGTIPNLFAALGWHLVDLMEHPAHAERVRLGDAGLALPASADEISGAELAAASGRRVVRQEAPGSFVLRQP